VAQLLVLFVACQLTIGTETIAGELLLHEHRERVQVLSKSSAWLWHVWTPELGLALAIALIGRPQVCSLEHYRRYTHTQLC